MDRRNKQQDQENYKDIVPLGSIDCGQNARGKDFKSNKMKT